MVRFGRLWSTGATPDEPLAADTEWAVLDGKGRVVVLVEHADLG